MDKIIKKGTEITPEELKSSGWSQGEDPFMGHAIWSRNGNRERIAHSNNKVALVMSVGLIKRNTIQNKTQPSG